VATALPIAGTLRTALLPVADAMRSIPGMFGVRNFTLQVITRTWSGTKVGEGTVTLKAVAIYAGQGKFNARVRQVSQNQIAASGGYLQEQDVMVGPITPPFKANDINNADVSIWDPQVNAKATEVLFLIKGPGDEVAGDYYKCFQRETNPSFRFTLWLRRTGELP